MLVPFLLRLPGASQGAGDSLGRKREPALLSSAGKVFSENKASADTQKLLFKSPLVLTQRVNWDCARFTDSSNSTFESDKYLGMFPPLLLDHTFHEEKCCILPDVTISDL